MLSFNRSIQTTLARLLPVLPLFCCSVATIPVSGQTSGAIGANRPLPAVRLPEGAKPPAIDGDLSDAAWQLAAKATLFYDPQTGKPVHDQTEAYLIYDSAAIYIAFYCHDSQPDSIVARETVRDADLSNDDAVRVEFDPFLSYKFEDYASFTVNAIGTRKTQLGGGRAGKVEWQGDWDAATRRVKDGWTVELRIPWAILSYPSGHTKGTIGLNFRRRQQSTHIESLWSNLGPQYFNDREGLWQGVDPPSRRWKPRFSALPYLLPGFQLPQGHGDLRSGVDARYQPTPELTGVATVNPDFQSVEGAVESIGFSRSERFVPDKRPFFLEGSDYVSFGEDYQIGSYFDTYRIRHVDTGLKLYGKLGTQTTLGILDTIAFGRESNFAAQIRRDFSPTSGANLILTQRIAPGEDNTCLAFGPNYRWGKWSVDGQVAQTEGPDAGGMAWTGAVNLSDKNLFTTLRYRRVGTSFLDRLGFIDFNDFKGWSSYTNWSADWRHGALRGFNVDFSPTWDWHIDGRPFRRNASFDASIVTRSDYSLGVNVEAGTFDRSTDFVYGLDLGGGVSNRFRQWHLFLTTGKQADLPYTAFGPSFSIRLFKKLDLAATSFVQNYQGVGHQEILTFNYELSPYRAWGGRLVIENSHTNVYFSYHNSGRRGTDTYFLIGDPNSKTFVSRVMLKFVFAL